VKILMLVGNEKDIGTYHRAYDWATYLVSVGHTVTIACDGHKRFRTEYYREAGINIVETPYFMDGRFVGARIAGLGGWGGLSILARRTELLRGSYDVVHSFEHYPHVLLPVYTTSHKKVPVFLSDWCDHYGKGGFRDTYDLYRLRAVYRILGAFPRKMLDYLELDVRRRANAVTVISKYLFDRAVAGGIDPSKVTIIRGSVNTAKVRPMNQPEARDALGIGRELHVVTFLGTGQFDLDFAMNAFANVSRELPDARFLVVGRKTQQLEHLVNNLSLSDKVILTGWCPQNDLISYLSCADVFVIPLRDNPVNHARWPGKIGEYMAIGRPIVCSRVGDVAELVDREQIGVVAGNDSVQFGTAILKLLKNRPLADRMGTRARRIAEQQFDVAVQGSQLERLYRVLLSRRTVSLTQQEEQGVLQS
jgi:glycosyltransferase involved in cell wall biosynthesis